MNYLYDDVGDDYDYDYWGSELSIPEELADFYPKSEYPKDNDSVNSFIDLYILIEKLMKMIHFRNEAVDLGARGRAVRAVPVQFESDLKVLFN